MRIQLSDVAFRYEQEVVLRNLNLEISSGSLTVFCGPTGSGKSTLLRVISGLEAPSSGTISYSEANPRRSMAIVFQSPETQIFASTVQQDLEYGLKLRGIPKQERAQKAAEALRNVGLEPAEFFERSPFLLSGGEKRRVVIAGALALNPQVLILDEPTAGLDPAACRELLDVLKRLRERGLTILVSTHDLDLFFPVADQVCVLRQGELHFSGSARELVASPDILESAGLKLPTAARIAYRLREKGIALEIPVGVEELVTALKKMRFEVNPPSSAQEGRGSAWGESSEIQSAQKSKLEEKADVEREQEDASFGLDWNFVQKNGSLVHRLDPRMKWLGMLVLSFALLQIRSEVGVVIAILWLAWLMRIADLTLRKMFAYLRPFLIMFSFLWMVSAIVIGGGGDLSLGSVGISYEGVVQGGLGVLRFLFVIALGFVFTETTTGAPLREGFEWGIRPLRKINVPTRELSLAVSIALQFVPWILEKVLQLREALVSRGLDTAGIRKWTLHQIVLLIVPLLILVIKMGDELATAIESRGYDKQVERTSWYQLRWTGTDTIASVMVIGIAGLLLWLA
jgi:energy-coupling factor transporter ATP-binding protein EcfA2/energy-coupling factor transporter transmembrane protein EcfT